MMLMVIDDHPVVLEGLVALLRHGEPDWVVLQAAGASDGLALLRANPDVAAVLLDLAMPGLSGMEAVGAFLQASPGLAVIVISALDVPGDVRRALALGARGYIPKSSRPQTLLAAVRLVLAGEIYVPPAVLAAGLPGEREATVDGEKLTPRQAEILERISAGQSNKDIGAALGISDKTVKAHVGAVFRILGVVNRTQAAAAHRAKR